VKEMARRHREDIKDHEKRIAGLEKRLAAYENAHTPPSKKKVQATAQEIR
jgi:BMFP domain-containing protein YqiC